MMTIEGNEWEMFLYWPRRGEYRIPLILGLIVSILLGSLGFPTFSAADWPVSGGSVWFYFSAALLLTAFNGLLLYTRLRQYYLTWQLALRPLLGTLGILSLLYPFTYSTSLALKGVSEIAFFSGEPLDLAYTLRVAVAGLAMLSPFLALSALWPGDAPKTNEVRAARTDSVLALDKIYQGDPLDDSQYQEMLAALTRLKDTDLSLKLNLQTRLDKALLEEWIDAAGKLQPYLRNFAVRDLKRFKADPYLKEQLQRLKKAA